MNDTTIRLGIIGTGLAVEKLHWPALQALPGRYEITAFCDTNREHAEHFASYSGADMANYTKDYHQLLAREDVDAVLISLPIPLQAEVPRHALEAGKHVICEKPPGPDEPEARELVTTAKEHKDKVLLIAENYFYRDDLRWAKSLIEKGELGRVHMMAYREAYQLIPREGGFSSTPWRWEGNYRGGPHLDGGVHHTAQIRMLMGDAARLSATMQDANTTHNGPSDLTMTLTFVSGAAGSYSAVYPEFPMPPEPNEMRIYGTDGVMAIREKTVALYRADEVLTWEFPDQDGGYTGEFQNFHEAVVRGAPVVGTLGQSVRNMELITKAIDAAESGTVIELDDSPMPLAERAVPIWMPYGDATLTVDKKESREARSQ